jgi:hypothetical protein
MIFVMNYVQCRFHLQSKMLNIYRGENIKKSVKTKATHDVMLNTILLSPLKFLTNKTK